MPRLLHLLLTTVLVSSSLGPETRADAQADTAFYAVSYIEVMASANAKAIGALRQYRDASRKQEGYVRLELFEQVGRPDRFAVIETWRDQKTFDAHAAVAQKPLLDTLQPIRVSGYDQRPYKTLTVGPAPPATSSRGIFGIAHVGVTPAPRVPPLLNRLAEASRHDEGNVRFDVLQHAMR